MSFLAIFLALFEFMLCLYTRSINFRKKTTLQNPPHLQLLIEVEKYLGFKLLYPYKYRTIKK